MSDVYNINTMISLMGTTNARYQNSKNFITSFQDVFGDYIKYYELGQDTKFIEYELNPNDSVYVNVNKIRESIAEIVKEYKKSLNDLSKILYEDNVTDVVVKTKSETDNTEFKLLIKKLQNMIKTDSFDYTKKEAIKSDVSKFLSLYKSNENQSVQDLYSSILILCNFNRVTDENLRLQEIIDKIITLVNFIDSLNVEDESKYKNNKYQKPETTIDISSLSYSVFISKIKALEAEAVVMITDIFKDNFKYKIYDSKELEIIFKNDIAREDNDDFSSDFGLLVGVDYDNVYFKYIEEQIANINNGSYVNTNVEYINVFKRDITYKTKGELIATISQTADTTYEDGKITFAYDLATEFKNTDYVGKYLKNTRNNDNYYKIVDYDSITITILVPNKKTKFNIDDIYNIYEDYTLDDNVNILSSIRNSADYYSKQLQSTLDSLTSKINNTIINIVVKYFKVMFLERRGLLSILNGKVESFYMGQDKVKEIIALVQSSFAIVRPPIINGDYGDENGLGGQKFSEDYDPFDEKAVSELGNGIFNNRKIGDKYPIGEAYYLLHMIDTILDWYIEIFKMILGINLVDMGDIDTDMLNDYITGYKNPLSLSVLSPVIKIMRNVINDGINTLTNWIRSEIVDVEGEFSGSTLELIEKEICKKTKDVLVRDTLNLDVLLRENLGNNLFDADVVSKAYNLLEDDVDESREYLLDEINKKISQGTAISKWINQNNEWIRAIIIGIVLGAILFRLAVVIITTSVNFIENLITYFINLVIANIESNLIQDSNEELIKSYDTFKTEASKKSKIINNQKNDDITELIKSYQSANETQKSLINTTFNETDGLIDFAELDKYSEYVKASLTAFNRRMDDMAFKVHKTADFSIFTDDEGFNISSDVRVEIEERLLFMSSLSLMIFEEYKQTENIINFKNSLDTLVDEINDINVFYTTNYDKLTGYDKVLLLIGEDIFSNDIYTTNFTNKELSNGLNLISGDGESYTVNVIVYVLRKLNGILEYTSTDDKFLNYAGLNFDDIRKEIIEDVLLDHLEVKGDNSTVRINENGLDNNYIKDNGYTVPSISSISDWKSEYYTSKYSYVITRNDSDVLDINDTTFIEPIYKFGDIMLCNFKKTVDIEPTNSYVNKTSKVTEDSSPCELMSDSETLEENTNSLEFDNDNFFDENTYRLSYVLPDISSMMKFDWVTQYISEVQTMITKVATELDKPEKFYKLWVKKNIQYYCDSSDLDYDLETGKTTRCISDNGNYSNFNDIPQNDICEALSKQTIEEMKKELEEAGISTNLTSVTENIEKQGSTSKLDKSESDSETKSSKDNMKKYYNNDGELDTSLLIKVGLVVLDNQSKLTELPDGIERDEDGAFIVSIYPLEGEQAKLKINPMDYTEVCKLTETLKNSDLLDIGNVVEDEINKKLNILPKHLRDRVKGLLIVNPDETDIDTDFCI